MRQSRHCADSWEEQSGKDEVMENENENENEDEDEEGILTWNWMKTKIEIETQNGTTEIET